VCDALTWRRDSKPPVTRRNAARIIARGRGEQFDPDVVDAFMTCKLVFERSGPLLHGSSADGDAS
jgi:response regulator RpfG family c-di-GMP phosphodiesterase